VHRSDGIVRLGLELSRAWRKLERVICGADDVSHSFEVIQASSNIANPPRKVEITGWRYTAMKKGS
jgi:hypothetical protein